MLIKLVIKNVFLIGILVGMTTGLFVSQIVSGAVPDILLAQVETYCKSDGAITNIAIQKYESAINAMAPDDQRRVEVIFQICRLLSVPLQKSEVANIDNAISIYNSILNNTSLPENHFWKLKATYYLAGCYGIRHDERAKELCMKVIETNPDEVIFPFGYDKRYYKEIIRDNYQQNAISTIIELQSENDPLTTALKLEILQSSSDNIVLKEKIREAIERYMAQSVEKIMKESF